MCVSAEHVHINSKLDVEIHGSMAFTLVWGVFAFTVFYVYLVLRRLQLAELEEGLEERELEHATRGAAARRADGRGLMETV